MSTDNIFRMHVSLDTIVDNKCGLTERKEKSIQKEENPQTSKISSRCLQVANKGAGKQPFRSSWNCQIPSQAARERDRLFTLLLVREQGRKETPTRGLLPPQPPQRDFRAGKGARAPLAKGFWMREEGTERAERKPGSAAGADKSPLSQPLVRRLRRAHRKRPMTQKPPGQPGPHRTPTSFILQLKSGVPPSRSGRRWEEGAPPLPAANPLLEYDHDASRRLRPGSRGPPAVQRASGYRGLRATLPAPASPPPRSPARRHLPAGTGEGLAAPVPPQAPSRRGPRQEPRSLSRDGLPPTDTHLSARPAAPPRTLPRDAAAAFCSLRRGAASPAHRATGADAAHWLPTPPRVPCLSGGRPPIGRRPGGARPRGLVGVVVPPLAPVPSRPVGPLPPAAPAAVNPRGPTPLTSGRSKGPRPRHRHSCVVPGSAPQRRRQERPPRRPPAPPPAPLGRLTPERPRRYPLLPPPLGPGAARSPSPSHGPA